MVDVTAVAALVIAAVALVLAAAQLTQQLLATSYVLRKCDRIVTGGLVEGGKREWRWRQFRFTVKYQAIMFALPDSVYASLGVTPTVRVSSVTGTGRVARAMNDASATLHERAKRLISNRRVSEQAGWVTMVQDIAATDSLPLSYCLRQESGDRIPEDLTVAPIRVDALTILLTGLAMKMQVFRYSPTMGEVSLTGPVGSISSSIHPVLGGLTHYSAFRDGATIFKDVGRENGIALCGKGGVWANAVFGRFKDRSIRHDFVPANDLRLRYREKLQRAGWPNNSYTDTIGGAACFLSFAHVDVYRSGAPSAVRPWCAHFAEFIVATHHEDIIKYGIRKSDAALDLNSEFSLRMSQWTERYGCSSPYIGWEDMWGLESALSLLDHIESSNLLVPPSLIQCLQAQFPLSLESPEFFHETDPSTYVESYVGWEVIMRADQCMSYIARSHPDIAKFANIAMTKAVCSLAEVGPPSWRTEAYRETVTNWPTIIDQACSEHLDVSNEHYRLLHSCTQLSLLRAAYFTIMMRGSQDIGSGLSESSKPETALLYMA